jgi:hypothetical protein
VQLRWGPTSEATTAACSRKLGSSLSRCRKAALRLSVSSRLLPFDVNGWHGGESSHTSARCLSSAAAVSVSIDCSTYSAATSAARTAVSTAVVYGGWLTMRYSTGSSSSSSSMHGIIILIIAQTCVHGCIPKLAW